MTLHFAIIMADFDDILRVFVGFGLFSLFFSFSKVASSASVGVENMQEVSIASIPSSPTRFAPGRHAEQLVGKVDGRDEEEYIL